ncbi:hypothetical protein Pla110_44230 [Polystyrenella longa]|uniref:Uncharacterized protein n=1 Tax=Polystyrenella longa TaxID=2528007 RepID=A0A518CTV9_9PLAN|nr:hypothetical protein [Polystyrenella longa]QDU82662.1 hypothetical protein Pla110_44230 [Polystyrenella longa]
MGIVVFIVLSIPLAVMVTVCRNVALRNEELKIENGQLRVALKPFADYHEAGQPGHYTISKRVFEDAHEVLSLKE